MAVVGVLTAAAQGAFTTAGSFTSALGASLVTPALVAGTAMGAYGAISGAQAQAQQAKGQQAMALYNSKLQEREAQAIERFTTFKQKRQAKEAERVRSWMQAEFGVSGAVSDIGTPLVIQARQAEESELDNLLIGYEGRIGSSRAISQGAMDKTTSDIFGQQAKSARTAGIIGVGSTLLAGAGKIAR